MTTLAELNDDFRDVLVELCDAEVEFLIVGAYALALHGVPRTTGDIDIFVRATPENAGRLIAALERFGAPLAANNITAADFEVPGLVYQIGLPPRRIDILTRISGVTFEEAWQGKTAVHLEDRCLYFLSRDTLIKNKLASGRPKDIADASRLQK